MPINQLSDGNPDGTQIGQSATDKVAFFGGTPATRPTSADLGPIIDSTGGVKNLTFGAIAAGAGYTQADAVAIKNALAQIAATLNALRTALATNLNLHAGG